MEGIEDRLSRIEAMLNALMERQIAKPHYTIEEFARLVGREPFTCREYCRLGRIRAQKKASGRGKHASWSSRTRSCCGSSGTGCCPTVAVSRTRSARPDS